ncbi:insulinase family protein [Gillisia sp. M10.2A]|uniref:Insulinase family protein n=1 Tax=Gillisia lutea TaxID=2909668 RepID=A0ABS9EG09_9FLAO|nr:M16 family metallopeptidase [Gillisia lutea]MCF4100784.1 insulinase family protein [Gillisia lutea]
MQKIIIVLFLFLICGISVFSQEENSLNRIPLDTAVKIGKLPNGITYYIRKNSEPRERAELNLVIKAGSLQENDLQKGLAHFTEHMAFNGTKSFPKNDLIDYLQKSGVRFGADLNAYTGFDETVYQLPIPTDDPKLLESAFQILSEWAGDISFEAEEIENERGVIIEEERQRGKNVSERLSKKLMPILLANSRYRDRLPIGETAVINNFEHKTLKAYYNDYYRPELQAVIAVGDFKIEMVEELIIKNFSSLTEKGNSPELKEYLIPNNLEPLVKIATDPEFPYTVASIIYKHPETITRTEGDFRNAIIRSAASSMISNRVQEMVKNGNAPFLDAGVGYGPFQGGMVKMDAFSIQVVAKKPEELKEAIDGIMNEIDKMLKFGFTETEFERVKTTFMTSIEKSLMEKDKISSAGYLKQYLKHFTSGAAIMSLDYSYDFYKNNLEKITLKEVNEMGASFITAENQIILVQAPEESKDALPSEKTLSAWVNNKNRSVSEYIDDIIDAPLIEDKLLGAKVIKSKVHKSIKTTEVELSNGVRIVLKPTDFKNDEILFTAFSPGGVSLAKEAEITSAKMADNIIASSGIGKFNSNQLSKLLTGKSLGVGPYIGTYSEGIKGFSSKKDIESALKLIYLYFSHPRKDTVAFNRVMENTRVAIEGKSSNPMSVFQDTINTAMNGLGAWAASTTLKSLEKVSLDKSYNFYQERFADIGDFTFLFVGNFKTEQLLPLLEKYLGSLPSKNNKESFRDIGLKPLPGKVVKKVYRGLEDKAVVVLSYHDKYKYSKDNNLKLKALKSALETRLLERLREKESGVYSPSVSLSYVKIPSPYYSLAVSFSCASDRVEQLVEATRQEIEAMRAEGPTSLEIDKFVAQEKRQHEVALRTNNFWLSYLKNVYAKESDINSVNTYSRRLDNLKAQKMKKSARKLLDTEGSQELILLPENKK